MSARACAAMRSSQSIGFDRTHCFFWLDQSIDTMPNSRKEVRLSGPDELHAIDIVDKEELYVGAHGGFRAARKPSQTQKLAATKVAAREKCIPLGQGRLWKKISTSFVVATPITEGHLCLAIKHANNSPNNSLRLRQLLTWLLSY